jgi:hypothetical protein
VIQAFVVTVLVETDPPVDHKSKKPVPFSGGSVCGVFASPVE